ncbi:amidohydrolase family protein [Bradyrhizobium iriomotense]|uniref:Amidohydrolase-related domain-containing protein n=1 Tax=Bradyrhizobium iriomotense TaxID=441950 RepID=A0ABQ6B9Y1_9BRAD|nr:amidohydrolase family protein [Bradyrhizobium iriomotense]GLR91160.1 hypothetical protein GCM10007857_78760 [Bradyrhizobium iriomotense]
MAIYRGPIVDAHHHLWDLALGRHAWLRSTSKDRGALGDLAPIRRTHLPADYRVAAANQNVVATVHCEAGWDVADCVGETHWLESLAREDGVAISYVAQVPLKAAKAAALVAQQAGFARVCGIRDALAWDSDPARRFAAAGDLMTDPGWRSGFRALGDHALSFDALVFPRQLDQLRQLATDFPNQLIILNHCGSPIDRDPEGMRHWAEALGRLAAAPNVAIKISDLVAYDHHWTLDSLREVTLRCVDCFGPGRAMFASDFPVAGLHASFDDIFEAFKAIVSDFSESDQRALFCDTAARLYRLDLPSPPLPLASR